MNALTPVREHGKADFLASFPKAPEQRRLDIAVERAIDLFEEAAREVWNRAGVADGVCERLSLGDTLASNAWREAGLFCSLSCSTDRRSQYEVALNHLQSLFDKGGAYEATDGIVQAAAMAELERIS